MADIVCSNCSTANRPDRRFCRACGKPLAAGCPVCGASNDPDDRFCGTCGSELPRSGGGAAGAVLPDPGGAAPPRATERRLVTVLFADLVGYTALAADRDPEVVRDMLSGYFEVARERIERYGGTVEKFIGDAVMAVWGTPQAKEDDAERAVRAALEVIDAVKALPSGAADWPRMNVRAAVLTGEAAVDPLAVGQGMVTGDLVNTASRLQGVAEPGTVLVGEATVRATERAIAYEPAGEFELKGKADRVQAWQATRVVGGIGGAGRTARLEPPFVGRDDELRLLKEMFHATEREGRARLVSVIGIAGIGKTRLAWELSKYLDGLVGTVYWHHGRSPAYGEGLAFWALGEMVRGRAGILESDDRQTSTAKLDTMLRDHLVDADERERVGSRLAGLLGLGEMPPGDVDEIYAAWRTLFERIAEKATTVLVFEDVHWAEAGLLDFIESLVGSPKHRPILVVTLARPELIERRPTWGAGLRRVTGVELGPISDDAMELLLVGLVPGIPPSAIEAIRDRSEGVPLYAVETVRMLEDQGTLTETDGRYRLTGSLASLAVPESLTGLLSARLDTLSDAERDVLGYGAVIGQMFAASSISALRGGGDREVAVALVKLVGREILELDDEPRSPTRGQHRFVQGLMREVVYGRLSRRERVLRHLAAADLFGASGSDELAGVIASHLVLAYRASADDEAAALRDRARDALVAAADRARALGAHERSIGYLEEALGLSDEDDDSQRMPIEEAILEIGVTVGRHAFVVERARAVRERYLAHGDGEGVARATTWEGLALVNDGRPMDAVATLSAGLQHAGGEIGSAATARLAAELARAHLMSGEFPEALQIIEATLPVAERLDLRAVIAEILASKGWALSEHGRTQEAAALFLGAIALSEREGVFNAECRARMNLSAWWAAEGPAMAFSIAREGHERALARGDMGWALSLFGNASSTALVLGDWDWIRSAMSGLEPDYHKGISSYFAMGAILDMLAAQGDFDAVRNLLAEMRGALDGRADPQIGLILAAAEAQIMLAEGSAAKVAEATPQAESGWFSDWDSALEIWCRAAAWSGKRNLLVDALTLMRDHFASRLNLTRATLLGMEAALLAIDGDVAGAVAGFDDSVARLRALGATYPMAMTLLDRVTLLPSEPGTPSAAAEAREIFERLGARAFIARLDSVLDATRSRRIPSAAPAEPAMSSDGA
ncbi:MAG: adenylate/guanylate cyclase domain-containing protein [Chloroflexota bacterium]